VGVQDAREFAGMSLYDSLLEKMEGRQYSNYFSAFCPFEQHAKPAMLVYDDGQFVCLSCGKKGSLKYLSAKVGSHFRPQRMTQSQSVILPRWRKWEERWGDVEGIARNAHKSLKAFSQFQNYFKKRRIYEYAEQGLFGYIDGWATFPVFNRRGQVIDIVVRAISDKGGSRYVIHPDTAVDTRPLYSPSWQRVDEADRVYVVYGLIDSWAMEAIGLPCVTGITGKSLSADLLKPLGKRLVIVPDLGEEREAFLLANKLGWRAEILRLAYPSNTKDCDNIRIQYGEDYLRSLLGV
jgi:hypothetical protein